MGLFSKDIATFDDLFLHGLQDIYYAENQILKALPNLIDAATNPQLQRGLKDHLKETEGQVARLQQIFEMREEKPKGTKCPGINGLISEGDSMVGEVSDTRVLDAAIIGSAQAVEHYEITRYESLIAWATEMGRNDFADILRENLAEEVAANERLSLLGDRVVNKRAAGKPTVGTSARRTSPAAAKKPTTRKAAAKGRSRKRA
jgi:ferritin-like metal-binding protein YciE